MIKTLIGLALALIFAGCAPSYISRQTVVDNIAPVLDLEKRVDRISQETKYQVRLGILSREGLKVLKGLLDIYYVYYLAANVSLAKGDIGSYQEFILMAAEEVKQMETLIGGGQEDSPRPEPSSI